MNGPSNTKYQVFNLLLVLSIEVQTNIAQFKLILTAPKINI